MKYIFMSLIMLSLLIGSVRLFFYTTPTSPIDSIEAVVISHLTHLEQETIYNLLVSHYQILGLLQEDKTWSHPELQKLEFYLLPPLSQADLKLFVSEVAKNLKRNNYLENFLLDPELQKFTAELQTMADQTGHELFPKTVTLAIVLDRLNEVMLENPAMVTICMDIFKKKQQSGWMSVFITESEQKKLLLVEKMVQEAIAPNSVDTDTSTFTDNITWATDIDIAGGFTQNAAAGQILTKQTPDKVDQTLQTFSKKNRAILFHPSSPRQWADLYVTWNLAFVARNEHFPFMATKLIIPSVSNYHQDPEGFLHPRVLSLYTFMNYYFFERMHHITSSWEHPVFLPPSDLVSLWGAVNAESAVEYAKTNPDS